MPELQERPLAVGPSADEPLDELGSNSFNLAELNAAVTDNAPAPISDARRNSEPLPDLPEIPQQSVSFDANADYLKGLMGSDPLPDIPVKEPLDEHNLDDLKVAEPLENDPEKVAPTADTPALDEGVAKLSDAPVGDGQTLNEDVAKLYEPQAPLEPLSSSELTPLKPLPTIDEAPGAAAEQAPQLEASVEGNFGGAADEIAQLKEQVAALQKEQGSTVLQNLAKLEGRARTFADLAKQAVGKGLDNLERTFVAPFRKLDQLQHIAKEVMSARGAVIIDIKLDDKGRAVFGDQTAENEAPKEDVVESENETTAVAPEITPTAESAKVVENLAQNEVPAGTTVDLAAAYENLAFDPTKMESLGNLGGLFEKFGVTPDDAHAAIAELLGDEKLVAAALQIMANPRMREMMLGLAGAGISAEAARPILERSLAQPTVGDVVESKTEVAATPSAEGAADPNLPPTFDYQVAGDPTIRTEKIAGTSPETARVEYREVLKEARGMSASDLPITEYVGALNAEYSRLQKEATEQPGLAMATNVQYETDMMLTRNGKNEVAPPVKSVSHHYEGELTTAKARELALQDVRLKIDVQNALGQAGSSENQLKAFDDIMQKRYGEQQMVIIETGGLTRFDPKDTMMTFTYTPENGISIQFRKKNPETDAVNKVTTRFAIPTKS